VDPTIDPKPAVKKKKPAKAAPGKGVKATAGEAGDSAPKKAPRKKREEAAS
jgi:hypothetical protein